MDGLVLIPSGLPEKTVAQEMLHCNEITSRYGLALTPAEAKVLAQTHSAALVRSGRMEFGGGMMHMLILAFCDSPYIVRGDYADTIGALTRIFYSFKTNAFDEVDDAETIALMRRNFDEWRGALDRVEDRMENAARNVRCGRGPEDDGEEPDEGEETNE